MQQLFWERYGLHRQPERLNASERLILQFLLTKHEEGDDYHTYSRDPQLLKFTGKGQWALSSALRSLFTKFILESSHPDANPRLYWINSWNIAKVRELLGLHGQVGAQVALAYGRKVTGSVSTPQIAHVLKVSKRTAQRYAKLNIERGNWLRRKQGRKRIYIESHGQVPLTHWK